MTTYKSLLEMMQQVRRDQYRSDPERDAALTVCMSYCLTSVLEMLAGGGGRNWQPLEAYRVGHDPLHVIGWNSQWGVSEFMRHDDGWTIATFNGQMKRSEPAMWQPMPAYP